ncbi:hypothetical protein AVEN_245921-1 [Araneus ventricosus]|uniref:Uncharacterized protein n=1 Tax=Araneus ventricosus TaxID=182803 RepID=A0A4Y2NB27_ARAVE|nr:hypothetical protein AVEN_245921-1 [Araneus ventricosus]
MSTSLVGQQSSSSYVVDVRNVRCGLRRLPAGSDPELQVPLPEPSAPEPPLLRTRSRTAPLAPGTVEPLAM